MAHSAVCDNNATQNHEVRLYENDPNLKFEVIIGTLNPLNADQTWVSGVQGDSGAGFSTQDFCIPAGGTPPMNVSRNYEIPPCDIPIANADGSACDADSNANGDASGESNANANANSVGFADA